MSNLYGRATRRVVLESNLAQHFQIDPRRSYTKRWTLLFARYHKPSLCHLQSSAQSNRARYNLKSLQITIGSVQSAWYGAETSSVLCHFFAALCNVRAERRAIEPNTWTQTQTNMHTQANCENPNTRELEVEKEQSIAHNTNMNMIYELQKYMQKVAKILRTHRQIRLPPERRDLKRPW